MRRTGRLYNLTLFSCLLTVFAASLVAMWDETSAPFHLWFDIVPQGFGMASVITTTLIVSIVPRFSLSPLFAPLRSNSELASARSDTPISLPGHDRERNERGPCGRHGQYVALPDPIPPPRASHLNWSRAVTYLFRTTGQVIGVSLSGALLQTVLTAKLRERIQGPDAASVRHRRPSLPPPAAHVFLTPAPCARLRPSRALAFTARR